MKEYILIHAQNMINLTSKVCNFEAIGLYRDLIDMCDRHYETAICLSMSAEYFKTTPKRILELLDILKEHEAITYKFIYKEEVLIVKLTRKYKDFKLPKAK